MNSRNNEMEIDLLELFRVWKKKLWLIILVTFLGGTVGFAFSKIALTPMYTSTSLSLIHIYRACIQIRLCDPEGFFDLP